MDWKAIHDPERSNEPIAVIRFAIVVVIIFSAAMTVLLPLINLGTKTITERISHLL